DAGAVLERREVRLVVRVLQVLHCAGRLGQPRQSLAHAVGGQVLDDAVVLVPPAVLADFGDIEVAHRAQPRSQIVHGTRRYRARPPEWSDRAVGRKAGQMMHQGSTFTTRPQLAGTFGMVASTHWLASASGMAVLEQGGNAFDAAVAVGLVLQVVEPHLNGPGGEVPVIGFSAADGQPFVLDGQGPAPATATLGPFAGLGLDLIPGTGLLAACVPAAFGTWLLLLERYGTLPLRAVMEYAIGYAEHGYPMLPTASQAIAAVEPTFREHWPSSA